MSSIYDTSIYYFIKNLQHLMACLVFGNFVYLCLSSILFLLFVWFHKHHLSVKMWQYSAGMWQFLGKNWHSIAFDSKKCQSKNKKLAHNTQNHTKNVNPTTQKCKLLANSVDRLLLLFATNC